MMLVLVCANARLIVENLIKYGVLVNPARWLLVLIPDGALLMQSPVPTCSCSFSQGTIEQALESRNVIRVTAQVYALGFRVWVLLSLHSMLGLQGYCRCTSCTVFAWTLYTAWLPARPEYGLFHHHDTWKVGGDQSASSQ